MAAMVLPPVGRAVVLKDEPLLVLSSGGAPTTRTGRLWPHPGTCCGWSGLFKGVAVTRAALMASGATGAGAIVGRVGTRRVGSHRTGRRGLSFVTGARSLVLSQGRCLPCLSPPSATWGGRGLDWIPRLGVWIGRQPTRSPTRKLGRAALPRHPLTSHSIQNQLLAIEHHRGPGGVQGGPAVVSVVELHKGVALAQACEHVFDEAT
eukprot:EC837894.1.p2 GENE.EC837894.1~~EC837894.1.p2  ORF type:complete len:227 (-),score=22.19 EC837894.1:13-630(-)